MYSTHTIIHVQVHIQLYMYKYTYNYTCTCTCTVHNYTIIHAHIFLFFGSLDTMEPLVVNIYFYVHVVQCLAPPDSFINLNNEVCGSNAICIQYTLEIFFFIIIIIHFRNYAEFNEAGKYSKTKREYRSGKKCRNTKHHKVPVLQGGGGWPQN